jgi:hypothetical protein
MLTGELLCALNQIRFVPEKYLELYIVSVGRKIQARRKGNNIFDSTYIAYVSFGTFWTNIGFVSSGFIMKKSNLLRSEIDLLLVAIQPFSVHTSSCNLFVYRPIAYTAKLRVRTKRIPVTCPKGQINSPKRQK